MNALIVEDEAIIALSLAYEIEAAGHTVIGICKSSERAMELTRDAVPDFAFVDLRLGNKRCGATIDRYLAETFGTTSVYVTGNVSFAYKYRTCAIGFLEKPLDPRDVAAVIAFVGALREGHALPRVPARLRLFEGAVPQAAPATAPAIDRARA